MVIHVSETQKENDDAMREHGMSPTRYLDSLRRAERPDHRGSCGFHRRAGLGAAQERWNRPLPFQQHETGQRRRSGR